MTKKDKKEIVDLFNQGVAELILPVLETLATKEDVKLIREEMATKDDIKDIQVQLDSIERKAEAQQDRLDRHGQDIEKIKQHFSFA
jgi:hypothetical protein